MSIPYFKFWCQKVLPLVYDDSLSYYEVLCKVVDKLNQIVASTNNWQEVIDNFTAWASATFVTQDDLTNTRKLSPSGDFTGTLYGLPAYTVQSNRDSIGYLISQFQDGQTGLVIDCGFFTDSGIKKSYDGGVF